MDQDGLPDWSAPRDELEGLFGGYEPSASSPEIRRTAWTEQNSVTSPSQSTQYHVDASGSGIVRSPLQQATSSAPTSRPLSQRRTASASQVLPATHGDQGIPTASFEPPLRSIFVSGPPTASISANTALASLSAAVSSGNAGPLAALTNAGGSRRSNGRPGDAASSLPPSLHSRQPLINPEKDVDDPTTNTTTSIFDFGSASTPATVSRLFVPGDAPSPGVSRGPSYMRPMPGVVRGLSDTTTLTGHLFHYGFEQGRHSDMTIHAFGRAYRLHKLLLDRVPFFASAFSGSWAESSAKEMTIRPEEFDSNITKAAFELALKRIYGTQFPMQEEEEAIGLFATACWLDMPDLVDSCVESVLRQMQPSTLADLIKLVTNNYYGKSGDRILSSAKAMLCREGWEMPYEYWDEIPAEIIREIVGGDPFFVPGEWDRWYLATKLLNRRLRAKAIATGLVSPGGRYLHPKPKSLRFFAVRFDAPYSVAGHNRYVSEKDEAWIGLYTATEIAPLLVLLDEGIHYVHLRFEQLQQIRTHRDILGVPILPEKVISDALWMSMELRQKVLNSRDGDIELGLSEVADDYEVVLAEQDSVMVKGKGREQDDRSEAGQEMESGSWDGNASNSTVGADWSTNAARLSASLEPTDVAWALDFAGQNVIENGRPPSRSYSPEEAPRFSYYPPFRFSAEFPNPRSLKEKKRVYSQTVWYAGSLWNLYIQRVNNSKSQQLGIYLHRAKDKDPNDDPLAQFIPATVDDRIGQLEREMLLRKNERRNQIWRANEAARASDADREDDTFVSGEFDSANVRSGDVDATAANRRLGGSSSNSKTSQTSSSAGAFTGESLVSGAQMLDEDEEDEELVRRNRKYNVSTMPPYMDSRATIRTYFKIYSPSKAGRLLSIYESAPDRFDVSKSWGWKSSQMQLDDGIGIDAAKTSKDGKLRYMVVIGNV
ncbi:hypothetical protein LTR99_005101 [Exophiala xenobiotica]|uniref:BTB domain-containing protein n=1 Tax=Vermiconidia calcicola TaxID=1690605 RepID=A0AAV9QH71_9PEZI|nr:hypothetical protein LTR72_002961 [Exophiala xenobiotica]KAK5536433.1 hypothetical protein LTR23_007867 [Chaetothyriales sp. CCFEE 6169]KAK5541418.1 hypothetical protein LTR25_003195 [Vermiconidia calcicola]KAK5270657.1 hypothetical protein LTR96_003935 [Exophiala xenobiotica]KAK5300721.1 hypothetical protein LTR14_001119 [Exophiala xenobiotica]